MVEQIKHYLGIFDSQDKSKLIKKCQDHDMTGKLFCETCSCFFCLQCIEESVRSGHEVCDIEENPEIKAKILESNKYCKELEKDKPTSSINTRAFRAHRHQSELSGYLCPRVQRQNLQENCCRYKKSER
ncbi:unnamed protein product [Moneuplotes crassus]|uniref:Uncharacterized protein n=1 Tax=Euplotes crassus TaxID=5936 RepID=A0AAD1UGN8_EUPCR|nr:unnamed protein product [Moneuplotes crassus]